MEREIEESNQRLESEKKRLSERISSLIAEQEEKAREFSNKLKYLEREWRERTEKLEKEK